MTFIAIPQALEGGVGYNLSMLHKILRFIFGKNVANFARLQTFESYLHMGMKNIGDRVFFTYQ